MLRTPHQELQTNRSDLKEVGKPKSQMSQIYIPQLQFFGHIAKQENASRPIGGKQTHLNNDWVGR